MTDASAITNRYVAIWNEPNPATRRAAIEALWAPEGIHLSERKEARGYDQLEARIAATYAELVEQGGYCFRPFGEPKMHHNVIRFRWQMIPRGGGDPEGIGLDFFVLDADDRVQSIHQFIED